MKTEEFTWVSEKVDSRLSDLYSAVAYHFRFNLPETFLQARDHLLAQPQVPRDKIDRDAKWRVTSRHFPSLRRLGDRGRRPKSRYPMTTSARGRARLSWRVARRRLRRPRRHQRRRPPIGRWRRLGGDVSLESFYTYHLDEDSDVDFYD